MYTSSLVEHSALLQSPAGATTIKRWYFNGIRIKQLSGNYTSGHTQSWKAPPNTVTLYISIKGKASLDVIGFGAPFTLNNGSYLVFYSPALQGSVTNFDLQTDSLILHFTEEAFVNFAGEALPTFTENIYRGQTALLPMHNNILDLSMQQVIGDITECPISGNLKEVFLKSKCTELLVRMLYTNSSAPPATIHCKTEYDRERILFARDYLLQRVSMPPTLAELSRVAGINEFKLKHGFRELFGTTVFGYLNNYRLQQALQQLKTAKKTATEIAFELGYSSLQHFSKAFKSKYGVSPKPAKQNIP